MVALSVAPDVPGDFRLSCGQRFTHRLVDIHHPVLTLVVEIQFCIGAVVAGRPLFPADGSRIPVVAGRVEEDLIRAVGFDFPAIDTNFVLEERGILACRQRWDREFNQAQGLAIVGTPPVLPVILD
ncbi:MAG TPA: hypothetical protein DEO80_11660 [Leclercia adecarboxylata]|nr:hypothetical protein [Leclercia adecarboxylata]